MSGSNSSAHGGPPSPEPLNFSVHALPDPRDSARVRVGRLKMLFILALCAAPVVASYLAFYVFKPRGSAYGELILPTVDLPATLPLRDLAGRRVGTDALRQQWLLVVVQGAECPTVCERVLYVQRQLREMLGKERDRLDKVWLIPTEADTDAPLALRSELQAAVSQPGVEVTVLRAPAAALQAWLQPAPGHELADHLYVVDPMGRWMLREPIEDDPVKIKRVLGDLQRLLKASASWDTPGR